ncbi:DUF6702 family protein [Flagellimonas sp.]|jgi:hypothetical protein|uniref:DUF6702 family protein n=1 Tax=Flagellimonas sp. TaxID=2058762 RepID=UPI000B7094F8|nr:MAG: hypothetical protein CBB72_018340 [Muricauda sp. TMED12]|tara:strand:+ start:852 stop:1370 length:519 start_codon:yes stop_codon:yes gene_type:complete
MMKLKKAKMLILPLAMLLFLSFSSAHKFYVSVTNIVYSEEDSAFQITSRVFIDDLDKLLEERYGIEAKLATPKESKIAEEYIEKYFRSKFVVELDGKVVPYNFLGKKYDTDVAICYLEIPNVKLSEVKTMSVQNEVLTDLFDEQQNVVHVKWNGNKKSFVLIRENNKGMLNL